MKALLAREQSSISGDAVLTTNYDGDGIVRGQGFTFEKNFAITNGSTIYVLIDYTTFKAKGKEVGQVFVMPPSFQTTVGPVTVNVYRTTKYSGGAAFLAVNPNTGFTGKPSSGTTFTLGATGSDKGVLVLEYLIGGQSQGNQAASGNTSGLAFFIRPNTAKTLVEIVNGAAADVTFHWGQVIYEV